MEYLFYCTGCGFDEDEEPISIFAVDKLMSEPNPEILFCNVCNKEVSVKRYLGDNVPSVIIPQTEFKYQGKFKKFYEKKRDDVNRLKSTGLTLPEFVKTADIHWKETKVDSSGKEYTQKVYPKDNIVPTDKWDKIPKEKRKIAYDHGVYPSKDYSK